MADVEILNDDRIQASNATTSEQFENGAHYFKLRFSKRYLASRLNNAETYLSGSISKLDF
jgi:hypothetical protein